MLRNTPSGIYEWRARSVYEIVNEIGVAAIRAKSQRLIALADEIFAQAPAYLPRHFYTTDDEFADTVHELYSIVKP